MYRCPSYSQFSNSVPCLKLAEQVVINADSANPIACSVLRIDGQVPSPTPSVGIFGDSIRDTLIDGVPAESLNSLARIQAVNQPAVPPPTITMCSMGRAMKGVSVLLF